jgi:hypothetical protein
MATTNQDFRVKKGLVVQSTASFISTAQAVSTTSGAVQVIGGVGIGGNLWVGGTINVAGTINASVTGVITSATNIANGTAGQIPYQSAAGVTTFAGPGTAGQILVSRGTTGPTFQNTLTLAGNTGATSTVTGAFQVVGGAGIGENLYVGQNTVLGTNYNNTATGNKITFKGIIQTATLLSVIDTTINVALALPMNNWSIASTDGTYVRNVLSKDGGNSVTIGVGGSTFHNDVNIYTGPSGAFNVYSGVAGYRSYFDNQGILRITTSTTVSSTATGALQVTGGIGAGGGGFFGGIVTATNFFAGPWQVATATNLTVQYYGAGLGTIDTLNFATGTTATVVGKTVTIQALGAVYSISAGTDTSVSASTGAVTIWNTSTLQTITNRGSTTTNNIFINTGTSVSSTNSGALTILGGVGIGGGIFVGSNSTFTGAVLVNNNTAVASTNSGAIQIVNGGIGIGGGIVAGGVSTLTNTSQSNSTITGALIVAGGIGIGGNFYTAGVQRITNNTAASSTLTGALVVTGGVGIGGSLYAGSIFSNGSQLLPTNILEVSATGGQTSFTITGGYTVGSLQVFANGINLGAGDFVASNGTTVVVNNPRNAGDIMRFVSGQTSSSINNINALSLAYSVALGS